MTIDQLRKLHIARPFQPIDIHLADGRTLTVEHPELLAQSQSGRTIHVACRTIQSKPLICSSS